MSSVFFMSNVIGRRLADASCFRIIYVLKKSWENCLDNIDCHGLYKRIYCPWWRQQQWVKDPFKCFILFEMLQERKAGKQLCHVCIYSPDCPPHPRLRDSLHLSLISHRHPPLPYLSIVSSVHCSSSTVLAYLVSPPITSSAASSFPPSLFTPSICISTQFLSISPLFHQFSIMLNLHPYLSCPICHPSTRSVYFNLDINFSLSFFFICLFPVFFCTL